MACSPTFFSIYLFYYRFNLTPIRSSNVIIPFPSSNACLSACCCVFLFFSRVFRLEENRKKKLEKLMCLLQIFFYSLVIFRALHITPLLLFHNVYVVSTDLNKS